MPTYKEITCANCGKNAKRTISEYNQSLKSGSKNFYCSVDCFRKNKDNKINVNCEICREEYSIWASKGKWKKHFCSKCSGKKIELLCNVCGKKIIRYESKLRNYECRKSSAKNYCSVKCKNIGIRVPWNDLTRGMLKQRWAKEFGSDDLFCRRCGHNKVFNIVMHHKKYVIDGGDNNPKNLEPLCLNCHGEEHYSKKDND